jgi:hypothetical protein
MEASGQLTAPAVFSLSMEPQVSTGVEVYFHAFLSFQYKLRGQNQHTLHLRQIGWEQHTPYKHNTQTKNVNHQDIEFCGFLLNFNNIYEFYGS